MSDPIRAHLVANARYHDTDYARRQILTLLAEHEDVRMTEVIRGSWEDPTYLELLRRGIRWARKAL